MGKGKKKITVLDEIPLQDPLLCSNDSCPNIATFNPLRLRACSRCHSVQYCSTACQTNDWKMRHKSFCARLAAQEAERIKNDDGARPNGPKPGDIIIPVDTSQLDDIVDMFNALPKPYKAPSGMWDNHWSFDLRHVSLHPATDVVFLYHPASDYVHVEPLPKQTKNRVNPVMVAVTLLKCFNDGQQGCKPFAPWAWSAPKKDANFVKEVVQSLRIIGAREELCKIGVSRAKDVKRADEKWAGILSGLKDRSEQLPPPSPHLGAPATSIEQPPVTVGAVGKRAHGT